VTDFDEEAQLHCTLYAHPAVQVQYALTISPPGASAESFTTAAHTLYGLFLMDIDGVTLVAKRHIGLPWLTG